MVRRKYEKKYNLIATKEPHKVTNNIIFLGEIERTTDFEKGKNLPMIDENSETYKHLDDSGVVIKTDNDIIVISLCAHSGICNNILAVIGGFHLREIDNQTENTFKYMKIYK